MFLSSASVPLSSSASAAPASAATPMPTSTPTSPAASSDSAAAIAVADPQYFAYCLEAAVLLHNLGTHHHDRGTEGSDDAMRSYSESIQIRIKAQDVAEAAAKRYQQQQAPAEAAVPIPADDRPTQHEMAHRLAQLRSQSAQLRRAAADRKARAGASYVYPHDVPANLRRGETSMVGLNAFARPLLLPVSNGLGPATTTTRGHGEFTSSTSHPFQATADASTSINTSSSGISSSGFMYQQQQGGTTTTWSTTAANIATANQPPTSRRRGGLKRPTPSYHPIDASAPSFACTYPADCSTQSSHHDPTHLSSEVQKVNSLAAFTLYNIGLLHQTDRSHKEARESYEIATTMLQTVPPHLGQCTTVPLLRIMLWNNLGYVAYRTRKYDVAAELFQVASNASLDLSMLYAPTAVTTANPILESEGTRTSRRRLGRSNVAIMCNLSLALGRLGRNSQDVLDVSNAALQLSTRMEEDEVRYRQAVVAAGAAAAITNNLYHSPSPTGTSPTTPNDDGDGLDLSILPYVRARAHHGVRDGVTAMQQYRSFLSGVERSGHRSSHPYSVAAMQQVLTLSQSDALEAVEEMLRRVGDDHAAAAA